MKILRSLTALLFLIAFGSAALAWGTPTAIGNNNNSTGATVAVTGATATAGSLIVVAITEKTSIIIGSVSDSAGNTYSLAASESFLVTASGITAIFYSSNVAGLSSGTITYTKHASTVPAAISAFFVTGENTSSPLDTPATAVSRGSGFTLSTTSGVPANSGELFVGSVGSTGQASQTQAVGWSAPPTAVLLFNNSAIIAGNLVNAGSTAQTYAPTFGNTENRGGIIVAFIPSGGAAPVNSFIFLPSIIP